MRYNIEFLLISLFYVLTEMWCWYVFAIIYWQLKEYVPNRWFLWLECIYKINDVSLIAFKFVNVCRYGSLIAVVLHYVLSSPRSVHCLIILYAFPASSRSLSYTQSNGRYYNTINDNHWYITHSLTNTLTEFMGFNSKIHTLYAFNRNTWDSGWV